MELSLLMNGAVSFYILVSLAWESTLQAKERETWTQIQLQNSQPVICLAFKM